MLSQSLSTKPEPVETNVLFSSTVRGNHLVWICVDCKLSTCGFCGVRGSRRPSSSQSPPVVSKGSKVDWRRARGSEASSPANGLWELTSGSERDQRALGLKASVESVV